MSVPLVNFYLVRDSHSEYSGYFLTTFKPRRDPDTNWVFSISSINREAVIFLNSGHIFPILEKFGLKDLKPGTCLDLFDGTVSNAKEAEKAPLYK